MAEYLTTDDVAAALGVLKETVYRWRSISRPGGRYEDRPFPAPDRRFGNSPAWSEERLPEIRAWVEGRPPSGRPPKAR